jgi:hypothetical protein
MAKRRVDNHLEEGASEALISKLLPEEWVMRKLHPDYGVDVTVEVFERHHRTLEQKARPGSLCAIAVQDAPA